MLSLQVSSFELFTLVNSMVEKKYTQKSNLIASFLTTPKYIPKVGGLWVSSKFNFEIIGLRFQFYELPKTKLLTDQGNKFRYIMQKKEFVATFHILNKS